jgi:hypothetical protein
MSDLMGQQSLAFKGHLPILHTKSSPRFNVYLATKHFASGPKNSQKRQHRLGLISESYNFVKEARSQRALKRTLCEVLQMRYKVPVVYIELFCLTEHQIVECVREKWRIRLAQAALKQMMLWWRQSQVKRSIEAEAARVHMAAFAIQTYWAKFKVRPT